MGAQLTKTLCCVVQDGRPGLSFPLLAFPFHTRPDDQLTACLHPTGCHSQSEDTTTCYQIFMLRRQKSLMCN
ncbi:hypothetical protein LDENG_00049240 [Lucifuga dentata]|nr:hypothetical protein LDENG_00049240 [Lucifuga dentata]